MTFNYNVEWEMDDDFIDGIVEDIVQYQNNYPSQAIEDAIDACIDDALSSYDMYDSFNIDSYYDDLANEVRKRYNEATKRKEEKTNKKKYYVELVSHIAIEDDNPVFERIIERNCKGIRQDGKDVDSAIDYIEKRMGMPFLGFHSEVPESAFQISAVYREDGEAVLEA